MIYIYLGELVVDVDEPHVGGVGVGLQDAQNRVLHLGLGNGVKTNVGEDLEHVDNAADRADCEGWGRTRLVFAAIKMIEFWEF